MKYRVIRWLGRNVFPEQGIKSRVDGVDLYLHPRDWIEYVLLQGKEYESDILDFIRENLRLGDTAIFAGTSFGLHLVVAANVVGSNGVIVGIEPQPSALLRTALNLRLNVVSDRAKLFSAALGESESTSHMAWASQDHSSTASMYDSGEGFTASILPLSRVIESLPSQQVRLLLLDVQGYESKALAGLGKHRPDILIVELSDEYLPKAGVSADDVRKQIESLGYSICGDMRGNAICWRNDVSSTFQQPSS